LSPSLNRPPNAGTPLRLTLPPDLSRLPEVRAWAWEAGSAASLSDARIFDLQVTVSEAAANAIEHASSEVDLQAFVLSDRLIVEVTNDGVFQPGLYKDHAGRRRGLGLPLIVSLADQVHVARLDTNKTMISLTFFLGEDHRRATTPATEAPTEPPALEDRVPARLLRFAPWLPLILFMLAVVVLHALGPYSVRENAVLITALNTLFVVAPALVVAFLAARSYMLDGSFSVLLLGAGTLVFGLMYLMAGPLVRTPNEAVTMANAGIFFGGAISLGSAVWALSSRSRQLSAGARRRVALFSYLGALILVGLVTGAALAGWTPRFYTASQGYSPLRIVFLSLGAVAFLVAAGLFALLYRRMASRFLLWCSSGLAFFGVAFSALAITEAVPGSPLNWLIRAGVWVGGLYLLGGVFSLEGHGGWILPLERSLRESEVRYKSLVDLSPDPILVISSGQLVFANPAAVRFFGAPSAKDVVGKEVLELVATEDHEYARARMDLEYGGAVTPPRVGRFVRLDGNRVEAEVTGIRIEFDGQPAIQLMMRDLTERKQAEEALRESDANFRSLFGGSPDAIFMAIAGGPIVAANPAACAMFGMTEEELCAVGRPGIEDPDDPPPPAAFRERTLSGKVRYEATHVRKSGVRFPSEVTSVLVEGGTRSIVMIRNITERKRAEEELRESEGRSAFLLELADALRPIVDPVAVQETASRLLGEHLKADRVTYFEVRGDDYIVERDYAPSVPHLSGRYPTAAFGERLLATYRAGCMVVSNDIAEDPIPPQERDSFFSIQVRAQISVPLVKNGEFVAGLAVHSATPRTWKPLEMRLMEDVAERTWAAVERSRAEAALQESEERMQYIAQVGRIGFVEWNAAKGTGYWSREHQEIFGFEPGSPMSWEHWLRGVHPEDRERVVSNASRLLDRGRCEGQVRGHRDVYRFIRPDGGTVWVESDMSVDTVGGEPVIRGSVRDVTERKEAEERLRTLAEENERLYRQQLHIAENLQAAFLYVPAELGSVRLGHLYRSATEAARVGGDFYDVFEAKDNKIAVLMGDVAGHGIEAARAATLVKDVVHAFIHQTLRTEEVLRLTNTLLIEKGLPGYVTLFLGILDTETGDLRYSSAGHPDMLVRRASAEIEHLGAGSAPLGIYGDALWKASAVELQADDLLVLFTDGVIEARRDGEFYGAKRLEALVGGERIPAEALPDAILEQVLAFSAGMLQDDLAILALRLLAKAETAASNGKASAAPQDQ
jgi:PAS domain S-box-containing protein